MRQVTAIAVVAGLAAAVTGCAQPGTTPAGTPTASEVRSAYVSAAPAPPMRASAVAIAPGAAPGRCGEPRRPLRPSTTATPERSLSDAQQRARRALESMRKPTPQRAPVPPRALPVAEACVALLSPELNLLAASGDLTEERLRAHLTVQGLEAVTVRAPLTFAGTVDEACLYGAVTPTGPAFELGPLGADGTCRP